MTGNPAVFAGCMVVAALCLGSCGKPGCGRSGRAGASDATAAPDSRVDPAPVPMQPGKIRISASGGVILIADYYPARDPASPAVVLFPGPPDDRLGWAGFANALQQKMDVHVLAVDLRGHGESTSLEGGGTVDWQGFGPAEWQDLATDGSAVVAWLEGLASRTGATKGEQGDGSARLPVAFVGAGLGATVAAHAASSALPSLRIWPAATVLVSPGSSMRGIDLWKPIVSLDVATILAASASDDAISWPTAQDLQKIGKGKVTTAFYTGTAAHGIALVAEKPDLALKIVEFLSVRFDAFRIPVASASPLADPSGAQEAEPQTAVDR